MKIYKQEKIGDNTIYCIMHWDFDMRSFQVNDKMILLIQDIYSYIHPDWKNLITGIESQLLDFLNQKPYSWGIDSIDEIIPFIEELIEDKQLEFTSPGY